MITQDLRLKSTEFKPSTGNILVKPTELEKGEESTETGIVLNLEQNQSIIDRPTSGEVIRIGENIKEFKKGMTVLWLDTAGQDLELQDGKFIVLREESVLGFKDV